MKKKGTRPLSSGTREVPKWFHYFCNRSLQAAALHSVLFPVSVAPYCKKRTLAPLGKGHLLLCFPVMGRGPWGFQSFLYLFALVC